MGRQSGGVANTKASSSIALLQERFRQLQKVKERREKRELLKMISESERSSPSNPPFRSSNVAFPQNSWPTATSHDHPLSLGLDLQSKQADLCGSRAPQAATGQSLWHHGAASDGSSKSFDNPDIDTSLHL